MTVLRDLLTATPSKTEYVQPTFPAGLAPTAVDPQNDGTGPLPKARVVVMPWTVAEGLATSKVLTPGKESTDYTPYTHNWTSIFEPMVRKGAPAQEAQCLAHFWAGLVGDVDYLVVKPELHFSQDGPDMPIVPFYKQVIAETGCDLFITTGTAGGVGQATKLGDVIIGANVKFNCQRDFKSQPWAQASYPCSSVPLPANLMAELAGMLPVNAARLPAQWSDGRPSVYLGDIETTDFFGFDTADDYYKLRADDAAARAVEMGDAVLGMVIADLGDAAPRWLAIRNASDPGYLSGASLKAEDTEAGDIYTADGFDTTIGSALVCWAQLACEASW